MKTIIIQGSSRSNGNTYQIAQTLSKHLKAEIIDLKPLNIQSYSYEHDYINDDFLTTMAKVVTFDTIIFITPVYWYSMSGIMKNFFDRITDCLKIDKNTGRKLRGKNMAAIACGSDDIETQGFFVPFKNSSAYLGMNYIGSLHTWIEDNVPDREVLNRIENFSLDIKNNALLS